jgi:iron complex outermembrane receptor protein
MSKAGASKGYLAASLQCVVIVSGLSLLNVSASAQMTDSSGRQLDEIMVVAQKKGRAESLQEVPISITAFSGADLDARFMQNLTGLSYTVPNVQLEEVGTFPGVQNFSIRGQGINSSIPSVDPTVGLFIDGVYMGTTFGTIIDMWDLESVEVLRGPQGLLFGRNVTGGAVTVRTRRPETDGDVGVRVRASGANEENYNIAGSVEGALVPDKFAAKLMVSYNDDNGYFSNTNPAVTAPPVPPAPVPGAFYINPATGRNVGRMETTVVRPTFVWTPTEAIELALIGEYGKTEGDGAPWTNVSRQRAGTLKEFTTQSDEMGFTDMEWKQGTFELNWDIGRGTITNIAGWRKVEVSSAADVDGDAVPVFTVPGFTDQDQFSNELRYAATFFDIWDMTTGIYYLDQDIDYREARYIQGGALLRALGGDMNAKNYGVFWNNDVTVAEVWTLTAGIRYSKEDKDTQIITGACADVVNFNCTFADYDGDWDNWTPKLGVSWAFAESAQAYTYWTKGFRAGGFNFRNAKPTVLPPGPTLQEEQNVWEIGIKSELWDNRVRLNLAYFYNQIDDIQREVNVPDPDVVVLQGTINAGDVTIRGVELDFAAVVTDNFYIDGTVGYMDGEYDSKNPAFAGFIGDDLPRLAPWSFGLGANYDIPLENTSLINLRADYGWRDRNAYNDSNTEFFAQQRRLGASASWLSPDVTWRVSLFGKNLLDQENWGNLTEIGALGYTAGPMLKGRQYGIEVQYQL